MRAVQLYIKLGKRANATISRLGYATKNALKHWHREFARGNDLSAGYVRTKHRYSDEQKRTAVEHYRDHGRCLAWTMKALGYPCRREQVSEKVVRRLMKQEQLIVTTARRRRYTSYQGELDSAPENLVTCDFHAADAITVVAQLPSWFEHYNTLHPHKALGYRLPQ